jgi:hypothetical protein
VKNSEKMSSVQDFLRTSPNSPLEYNMGNFIFNAHVYELKTNLFGLLYLLFISWCICVAGTGIHIVNKG